MQKLTKRILKIVGKISDEIINKYKLYDYKDKNIVQSLDLYIHTLNSLLYFKKLEEYVCVVVKLNFKKNKDCYIATIYPINKKKIERYINKK